MPGEPAPEQAEQRMSTPASNPPAPEPVTTEEDNDEPDAPVLKRPVEKTVSKPKPQTNQMQWQKK
jgi:hypothetical protein